MKVGILRDNNPETSVKWEEACRKKKIEYLVIDMLRNDWFILLRDFNPSFCVSRPPGDIQHNKKVFDEKLYIIERYSRYKVYPNYHETAIYENKASLAYFLQVNNIPHPKTFVSNSRQESERFINSTSFPIVAKTLIGAAGSGVRLLNTRRDAYHYVTQAFTTGIKRRYGPNRKTGNPRTWLSKAVKSPAYLIKKLREYRARDLDIQKGVVLFQKFVPHDYEWRCVKIGDSFFAYKKLKIGDHASGSKQFEYGEPPLELLNFTRDLCERFCFNLMALDIFHNSRGIFVNELQTIFGHKNPYICKVNDQSGRYLYRNNSWVFEPGDFNTNESYDLRLETAIRLHEEGKS